MNGSREALGRMLAREHPADADIVVPVPDSGVPAAVGYAQESGLPFCMGLIRNHYVGRTFIEPEQAIRDFGVRLKHNPVRALLAGKRVVLVDDSLVRGALCRKIVRIVRERWSHRSPRAHQLPAHDFSLLLRYRHAHARGVAAASEVSQIRPRLSAEDAAMA